MKQRLLYILPLAVLVLSASCERLFLEPEPSQNPSSIFQQTWDFADQEYSFFEFKGIHWDSVYTVYQPRISDDMTEEALFDELANMLYHLRDGHVNLRAPFDRSRNWSWYLNSFDNFDKYVLERHYFKEKQRVVGAFVTYDFGDVGYIYYESFGSGVSHSQLNLILENFKDKKGLIFDVRDNLGGSLGNVYTIGSHFVDESTDVAKMRYKSGPAHDDFEEFFPITFEPEEGNQSFTKPVVVLTNRKSYSAGNFFPTGMSGLDHVTIMGDTTGGGGGVPSFTELSNGWQLRVSSSQLYTLDGFNTEDGLIPDVLVEAADEELAAGKDAILEAALELLRK